MSEARTVETSARMDLRRLPGLHRLYADYLYEFSRAGSFYSAGPPFALPTLEQRARDRQYPAGRRTALSRVLSRQNQDFDSGIETQNQIDLLSHSDTVAIVAGQQIGLFGGPLFTVYKAIAAIRLAAELRRRGRAAVAVFWMATQDHDAQEISQASLLDGDDEIVRAQLPLPSAEALPVGKLVCDESIASVLSLARRGLSPELAQQLENFYRPGETLARAFARLLASWLRPWGLILLDPLDPALAELSRPVYHSVIHHNPDLTAALAQRNAELEQAGYPPQVRLAAGSSLLFWEHDARRHHLRRENGHWFWHEQALGQQQLLDHLESQPEFFSASALLRPLVQDFLLPNVAQITGPAETAYLAQSQALYGVLGEKLRIPPPLPWPRPSLTLTDAKSRRLLDRYQLTLSDLFSAPAETLLARGQISPALTTALRQLQESVREPLTALERELQGFDPTLLDPARAAGEKIQHQVGQLTGKIERSIARRTGDLQRQARHLANWLAPENQLQERFLCSAALPQLFGPEIWAQLAQGLDLFQPDHQILHL